MNPPVNIRSVWKDTMRIQKLAGMKSLSINAISVVAVGHIYITPGYGGIRNRGYVLL
jgi:hypothetical protein